LRLGQHRRFTKNHTIGLDLLGKRLFIKANPTRSDAVHEISGYNSIRSYYRVPVRYQTRTIFNWTFFVYDRCAPGFADADLLCDWIADAHGSDHSAFETRFSRMLEQYADSILGTAHHVSQDDVNQKLYLARLAPGGRIDQYYGPRAIGRPAASRLESGTLVHINGSEQKWDPLGWAQWSREAITSRSDVPAAVTQGDPTAFNIGWWSGEPVWFDYDCGGLNALPGEFACFIVDQLAFNGWLVSQYGRSAYAGHDKALLLALASKPTIEMHAACGTFEVRVASNLSPLVSRLLQDYIDRVVVPSAEQFGIKDIMDWIRPYIITRLLGVFSVRLVEKGDALGILALLYRALAVETIEDWVDDPFGERETL